MSLITTQADYYVYNGGTSANLQAAINSAIAAGKSLFLVPPTSAAAVFEANGLTINSAQGFKLFATPGSVTLKMSATADAVLTINTSNDVEIYGINFDAGYVPGAGSPITTNWAIVHTASSNRVRFEKCRFANGSSVGLMLDNCGTSQSGSTNPYGVPVTFDNQAAAVLDSEVYNVFGGAGIWVTSSPGTVLRGNFLHDIKGNGIYVTHQNDAPGTTQNHFDGILIDGNLVTDVDVYSTGTSGQEGNGIVAWLCVNVTITNNKTRYTRWSGIRLNSCSQVVCSGNSLYAAGETALYIEEPDPQTLTGKHPTGHVINGNNINHCYVGISHANWGLIAGNRLAVISNNVVRHVHKGGKGGGIGIVANADTTLTGNVIECCDYYGMTLGTNSFTRDILASGNVIRDCLYGIGTSSDPACGATHVDGNLFHFANASTNAVVATVYDPGNTNTTIPNNRVVANLAENQTANAWTKVINNFRSALTAPTSPSDGCEVAPIF